MSETEMTLRSPTFHAANSTVSYSICMAFVPFVSTCVVINIIYLLCACETYYDRADLRVRKQIRKDTLFENRNSLEVVVIPEERN